MNRPEGQIETLLDFVGPDDPGAMARFINLVGVGAGFDVEKMTTTDASIVSTFFEYKDSGIETVHIPHEIVAVHVFVQADPEGDYVAYKGRLFDAFPNDATRGEIEAALGQPLAIDEDGEWILYNYGRNDVNISLDGNGRASLVTVCSTKRCVAPPQIR